MQYNAYFPTNWYGTPGASYAAAPMVYQPTDTTQLGFTYQHVPFWQPAPGMMPQRPVPAQWHIVAPPVHASSFHHGYGGYGFAGHGCPCPACQMQMSTPAADTQPAPATPAPAAEPGPTEVKPEASIPPAPRPFENSAASGHIRRAGY